MDKLQLLFFFISGFFVSRLIIKTEIPQSIVTYLLDKKHLSLSKLIFYLIFLSAALSFFIPNAITVLTLLPIIELLRKSFLKHLPQASKISTILALSIMYGANIGGMGSVTATPANGILVTYLGLNQIADTGKITFATWLIWGVPLVILFGLIAWLVITLIFKTGNYKANVSFIGDQFIISKKYSLKIPVLITAVYFVSSFVLSLLLVSYPGELKLILYVSGSFTLLFTFLLFTVPMKLRWNSDSREVLLRTKDCYGDLPVKGFVYVGISVFIAGILYLFNLYNYFSDWIILVFPNEIPVFAFFLILALTTSFVTEFFSNTAVQLSLFVIVTTLASSLMFPVVEALIIITLSSTCAFMSPIATGVNGLAFGGVKNVSILWMIVAGLIMNLAGALLISFWIHYFVPLL